MIKVDTNNYVYAYEQMTNKQIKIASNQIKDVKAIPKGSCIHYVNNGELKKIAVYDAVWRIRKQMIGK